MPPTTILLVDDDPIARKVIDRMLTTEARLRGLAPRVVQTSDGQKAMAMIQQEKPALLITDLFMPNMDGFTLCRELRASPDYQRLPILVISGVYKDPQLTANLQQEFRAMFLAKPVQANMLADAVLTLVQSAMPTAASVADLPGMSSDTLPVASIDALPQATDRGTLAAKGVPRLLFDFLEAGSTGTLALARGKVKKEFYIRNGQAVAADSNLREEALGSLLVSKAIITEDQLKHLLTETKSRKQKMGTVLVELGWMSPQEVLNYLAAQVRKRIVDCLRWTEGSWAFAEGDLFGDKVIEHELDTAKLVFRGLYRTATSDALVSRFDADGERPLRLAPRYEQFKADFASVFGDTVLPSIAEGATLGSLVLQENGHLLALALESLLATGMAELEDTLEVVQAQEVEAEEHALDSISLERLGAEISRQFKLIRSESSPDDFDAPVSDRIFPDAVADEEEFPNTDSGMVTLEPPAPQAKSSDSARRDMRSALLQEYLQIYGKSPYEVLSVATTASQDEVVQAYQAKNRRFTREAFAGVDLGVDAAKLEAVRAAYDRAFATLSDPGKRRSFDTRRRPTEATDPLGAELAFNEGAALLQAGKPLEALSRFERAVAARPDQAAYHAYLGWALFAGHGRAHLGAARERLNQALSLDPDLPRAHELLGRLALTEGDHQAARTHLERTLEIDPTQPDAVDLLVQAHAKLNDARGAERFYRKLVSTLGDRAIPVQRRLWRELADLYEKKLGDLESARVAYEMAARLSPSDVAAQRKVVQLNAEDPTRWRESSRALLAEWQQRPDDRSVGAALVSLFVSAEKFDAASVAAAAMVLRGQADAEAHKMAERGRPRTLRPMPTPLPPEVLQQIAYPGEDADLEALLTLLADSNIVEPFTAADLGLPDVRPLSPERQPMAFRKTLGYVCQLLGLHEPEMVIPHPALDIDARLADVRPYALLAGPALLETTDTVELGFRLGRALALGTPGRIAGSTRNGRQLRPYFVASLGLARGSTSMNDVEADAVLRRLVASDPALKEHVAELGLSLIKYRKAVNLGAWVRALTRTATRIGLLISADLIRVGRAVAEEEGPAAVEELLAFALSHEYLDLRESLGMAGMV